jgi:copper chaperone CopZ
MKYIFIIVCLLAGGSSIAQIQSVSLQAGGLTCSMCSRAIYKSLQKVPDVASVQEDIEHSSYHIQFSDPSKTSLENLQRAVRDAGFSVVRMEIKANFKNAEVASDSTLKLNDMTVKFVGIRQQRLNGVIRLLILDRDYLLEKDRKKYAGSFEYVPASGGDAPVFHVTLPQS